MNRRKFIWTGALIGIGLPAVVSSSCQTASSKKEKSIITTSESSFTEFELNEITIDELQQKMEKETYTSRSITEMYLKRIDKIDKHGPNLNAVIEINPDALSIADMMDHERKAGKVRGPLHGIPVLIKDNIDTADKMMTTAGSLALEGHKASLDAHIIKLLRDSGAVLLGKTNLSEWANFRSNKSTSGWSSRGGQTNNPYVVERNPCGSSSGSAVAVAANLCTIAIGTETNGSISCPASVNGIVGIKPTVGLLSRSGIIPISKTQDTAGPMARTVKDAAILLGALTGSDEKDTATTSSEGNSFKDYTQFLDINGLQGKRIGIEKSFMKVNEGVDTILKKALELMKSKGASIVEVEIMKAISPLDAVEEDILEYEFKDGLNIYLSRANAKVKSLQELIAFDQQHEQLMMPFFKQEIFESAEKKESLNSKDYLEKLKKLLTTRKAIDNLIHEQQLDAIAGPTNGPTWCTDLINGDFFTGYGMYSPAAIAGYPCITVPMGLVHELPVGISFFSMAYKEPELLKIAYAYEQASKNRVAPKFKTTVNPL